ncbi:MAG TPA: tetratricopeptide repeat protein [Verrucomicrobiae bacterium]|jgi:tetratricopeptide (TPR) repeat protein
MAGFNKGHFIGPRLRRAALVLPLLCAFFTLRLLASESPALLFDQANKLYEQGKYADAARAYEKTINAGASNATVYFNLGNAWFKDGQAGRAIAAYRTAEKLAPRDPGVRFNLQFVRKQVSGNEALPAEPWQDWLLHLTLNEWTFLAAIAAWIWFILLALRELRPAVRRLLKGYTATAGVLALGLAACLAGAFYQQTTIHSAVVVAPNAVVRFGPLDESNVRFQLRDGSEIRVLDAKEVKSGPTCQIWLQIEDAKGRGGWLKREQVLQF